MFGQKQPTKAFSFILLLFVVFFLNTSAECASDGGYHLSAFRSYFSFEYLDDDDAETLGIETEGSFDIGSWHAEHRIYFEVADYPTGVVKGTNPYPGVEEATGINDLLTGFWFFKKKEVPSKWRFGLGPVFSFPTASDDSLGSGKYTAGPGIEIEYHSGKLTAGVLAFNLWSYAGDDDRKEVNSFMAKPFAIYELNETWHFISIPYGISYYWDKPSGDNATLPIGGGFQRNFMMGEQKMAFQAQLFKYVIRTSKTPEWDLRFCLEFSW